MSPNSAAAGEPHVPPRARASRNRWWLSLGAVVALAGIAAAWAQIAQKREVAVGFEVVAAYPHDPNAFTQGLAVAEGRLYEGTGQYGASSIRLVDLTSGRVSKQRQLNAAYFGEGITILDDKLYQLTWQNGIGLVYDLSTFNVERTFEYTGEGWGLTHDGENLIMSDGSATLRFLDPDTFDVRREVEVRDGDRALARLNELEYVEGEVWANIWYDDRIARISPDTGEVVGYIDLADLYPRTARGSEAVLNGIAYDAAAKRLFVTGKNWPQLYEIEVELARH